MTTKTLPEAAPNSPTKTEGRPQDTAEAYLSLLHSRGITRLFGNGGTDFAPLVEAMARMEEEGKPFPRAITAPHEQVAVSMAHGASLVSGSPELVMCHVTVGTANMLNGMMNACRSNAPVLFTAGRTPHFESGRLGSRDLHIHWAQESFDQGGIAREWTKWDYELKDECQLEAVVDRALAIAAAEPAGPVYLTLPREALAASFPDRPLRAARPSVGLTLDHAAAAGVEETARLLSEARAPLIITNSAGRDVGAVPALLRLADQLAIPVVEFNACFMNFPTTHPLHAGFDPGPLLADADVIVALEIDVPWLPARHKPRDDARVVHIGTDPLHEGYPAWGFPMDVAVRSSAVSALTAIADRVEAIGFDRQRVDERRSHLAAQLTEQREAVRRDIPEAVDGRIDFRFLSAEIGKVLDGDTVVVNEYDLQLPFVDFETPGSYYGYPRAGGLGWALGAALGVKIADPSKTVITCVGDGAYMFGEPLSAHWASRAHDLPTLTIIFDNNAWNAVRLSTGLVYPDGRVMASPKPPFSDLSPQGRFEKVIEAYDGYGERVSAPEDVAPALARALDAVRNEGRQALLVVDCARM